MEYIKFDSAQSAVEKIAQEFVTYSQKGGIVHISLSGGSTPKLLFRTLASDYADKVNWNNLHFWWGDERCVAPDDEESNYGEAQRLLFDNITIPAQNLHRIRGENDPEQEVKRFADEIKAHVPCVDGMPQFDWIILGMGTDGHTASLFPLQADFETSELAIIAKQPQTQQWRVSKSAPLLQNAKRITYLVTGASKADLVHEIKQSKNESALPYPAARIKAKHGITEWYLDADAAFQLK